MRIPDISLLPTQNMEPLANGVCISVQLKTCHLCQICNVLTYVCHDTFTDDSVNKPSGCSAISLCFVLQSSSLLLYVCPLSFLPFLTYFIYLASMSVPHYLFLFFLNPSMLCNISALCGGLRFTRVIKRLQICIFGVSDLWSPTCV